MDWDAMIADLESSFDAERRADLVAQSAELAEAGGGGGREGCGGGGERGARSAGLAGAGRAASGRGDRLRGSVGRLIHLRTRGGVPVDGVVCRVEPSYVLVDEGDGLQAVVPVSAVATVVSLAGPAPRDGRRRPTLTALMREIARRGARVRLMLSSGEVVGRLVRVGADHVDVAVDPEGGIRSRRAPGAGGAGVISVMTAAIEVLRSR